MTTESFFIFKQLWFLLKVPYLLIMITLGKRDPDELYEPFRDLWNFLMESPITIVLIFLNMFVFLLQLSFIDYTSFIITSESFFGFDYASIILSWFLHAGWLHLLVNMVFLFVFGRIVEDEYGWRVLLVYFLSAIAANFSAVLFGFDIIGSNGAIAGLIATGILLRPFYLTHAIGIPIPLFLIGWLGIVIDIYNLLVPAEAIIDHFSNIGAYLAMTAIVIGFSRDNTQQLIRGLWLNTALYFVILGIRIYFSNA